MNCKNENVNVSVSATTEVIPGVKFFNHFPSEDMLKALMVSNYLFEMVQHVYGDRFSSDSKPVERRESELLSLQGYPVRSTTRVSSDYIDHGFVIGSKDRRTFTA